MVHANAVLTPRARLRLAELVVEQGWSLRRAAERFQCSVPTVQRWSARYRSVEQAGREVTAADMADRSSRPHRSPRATRRPMVRKIKHLRAKKRLGPAMIAGRLGMHQSTVHRVLVREGMARLDEVDLMTGQPIRQREKPVRYERLAPGDLVHVDIKKLGRIPDGGGWRMHGRGKQADRHRAATAARSRPGRPVIGYGYVHSALDDHSRLTYSEILPDETGPTAAGFWHRAVVWFAVQGIFIERVLTDNGSCYRSKKWREAMANTDCRHKRTRPYRPQTNGKIERFHRTLLTEWAYARPYSSERARRKALPAWLHIYNHHRPHTALGGRPPASRVTNLTGQYS